MELRFIVDKSVDNVTVLDDDSASHEAVSGPAPWGSAPLEAGLMKN